MDRRTALITAASIVAVVVTGATAIGANIGILSNASASDVGELVAVADIANTTPVVIAAATPTPTTSGQMTVQAFEADIAGSVSVEFTADELRLGSVAANPGWTWSSTQSGDHELLVVFLSSDGREFRFAADLLPDGSVAAKVDELLVETVQGQPEVVTIRRSVTATAQSSAPAVGASATATASAQPSSVPLVPPTVASGTGSPTIAGPTTAIVSPTPYDDHDEYEDDDDDHDEYEDDEHEDDEHEDDEHEYEGAEDDD